MATWEDFQPAPEPQPQDPWAQFQADPQAAAEQPGYGQSLLSAAGRGFASVVPGVVGGVGYLTGSEGLVQTAEDIEQSIAEALPINPAFEDDFAMKAASTVGQVGSILATGGAAGVAGKALQGVRLAGQAAQAIPYATGVLQGIRGGGQEAEQYGMEGAAAYGRALAGGAIEGLVERLPFGMLTETAAARRLLGEAVTPAGSAVREIASGIGTEATEEGLAQIGGNVATMGLAPVGVETPGLLEGVGEAAALGAVGGAAFGGVNALVRGRPQTIESGEAEIPESLRVAAEAGAFPNVDELENLAGAAATEEVAAAVRQAAEVGGTGFAPVEPEPQEPIIPEPTISPADVAAQAEADRVAAEATAQARASAEAEAAAQEAAARQARFEEMQRAAAPVQPAVEPTLETLVPAAEPVSAVETPVAPAPLEEALPPITAEVTQPQPEPTEPNAPEIRQIIEDGQLQYQDTDEGGPQAVSGRGDRLVEGGQVAAEGQEVTETEEQRFQRIKAAPALARTQEDVDWANAYSRRRSPPPTPVEAPTVRAGFLERMTPMQRTKAEAALKTNMVRRNQLQSRREIVEEMVSSGATIQPHPKDKRRLMLPDGSFIEESRLTKTGMDYAEFLLSQAPAVVETEQVAPALPTQMVRQLTSTAREVVPAGPSFAEFRQRVLEAVTGQKVPKAKAGVGAVEAALYAAFGINQDQSKAGKDADLRQALLQQSSLLAVANNTATPEQVEPLVQRGLVRTINGQNVITDAGVALMPPEQRPRLTEAERVAEIQQITPTGVVPTESLPAGQPTPGGVGTVAAPTVNRPQTDTTPPAEPPLPPASMRAEQMARKRRGKAGVPQSVRDQDGAAVDVRVTPADAQRAREIEGKQIPGVSEAWVGTTDEFLAEFGDLPDFNQSTTAVRADGGLEAFYDPKMDRAFILIDRAQAREGDVRRAVRSGTSTGIETVRRLLRHEAFAHRGWRALPTNLKTEFINLLPNLITPDDIDSLVAKGYARYANWREDPLIYYMAAEEWLATRIERISKLPRAQQGKWTDFMDWLKRVFQWLTGDDTVEPTPKELTDIMRQMVRALEVREAEVQAPEVAGIRPSVADRDPEMQLAIYRPVTSTAIISVPSNDRMQRLSEIANSGSGKYRESEALPFMAEAVPGRPVREAEGQDDIARNLNYQQTKLKDVEKAALKFVDDLGPMEAWFDQLANYDWQQKVGFDPRSPFGELVLTEALFRTRAGLLVDPVAFTANRQLADYLNATITSAAKNLATVRYIHGNPRYIAMYATQATLDMTRKQQKTVIDPQVNVPQAVEAVQVADQRAREQATTETAEELDLDQIVLDLGMAALDPELQQDIREINNHVLRIGTLQRLRQRLTTGVSPSLANLSAADLEAQYAGLTVEQIDALLAQEQEALAARVAKVKGAMAGKPKQRVAAADSPVEQARKLIERLEAAPTMKKPGKPNPVRDLYKRHLKDPMTEADFVREMAAIGIPLEQATKLYEIAAVKIAAVEMARQARREASQEGKLNQAEKFAERTIDDVAQLMADPALPESERERKVLPIREFYNEHVRTGIEEESFVQQAIKLGLDEGRARRLWGAGTLVREARTRAKAAISEQAAIDKANKQEQRQIEMADKEAARIIYSVSRLHRQSGYINTSKDAPTIRKIFAEQVKKPETFEAFSDKLKPFKVSPGVITRLFNVAERETLARQAMEVDRKNLAEMRKLNARAANLLDPSKGSLLNALNRLRGKVTGDVNWSKIFEAPFERQQKWRVELYRALRADPALANLTPQEARDLAAEVDRIWNLKRQKAFDDQMKRVNLPGVKPEAKKKVQESAPQLLRYINVGTFGDDSFRQAVSKKFGIKALSADEIKRITELAQAAQAEGISTPERSRILDELVKTLQSSRNAEIGEILSNYWVTSVLSGFRTQFDTALAFLNGLRVMSQGVAYSAITKRNFKLAGRSARDYFKTLADTISEAVAYFVTGDPTLLDGYQYGLQTFFKEGVAASAPYDYFEQVIKSKDARALAKFSAYFMAGVQRAMRAFDHINSVSTTEGWKSLAVTLNPEKYKDARLPTPADVAAAREKAITIVGSDKGFVNRSRVTSATRQILNDVLGQEFPALLDEAREIGLISSYQNDPTGIGGIIYHTLLGVTNKAVQASGKFRDEGAARRADAEWSEAAKLADKATREAMHALMLNSRNVTGTRFVRFAGNRFNELLSFIPGAGLLRLYEKDMTESKRAMLITNNIVGGMLGLAVFTTLLRMLSDEEDDEKRGFRIEGSWSNLTPDQKNQLRSQERSPLTISFYGGDGKWSNFNYNSWPVAGILAAAGTLNDLRQYAPEKWEAKDMLDRVVSAAWAGVTTFKDLSALSGLMDLLGTSAYASGDPVESAKKWAAKFTANFGGGFIPRAVKDIDAMMDPEIRKPDDMAAYFAKEVPFFRRLEVGGQKLFNIFGEPVQINRQPWSRSYTQAELDDEYRTLGELNSRGLFLGAANPTNRTIGSGPTRRELTDREAELYMETAGKFYKDYIRSQGERLLRLPNEQAKKAISQDTERLRNAALRRAVSEAKKEGT